MVCQAASQTRFRAIKHENGIEGEPAIIVRVIACFQPLHDCQAEYFRHLLKPVTCMVKLDQSWPCPHHVAWQSPYTNCTCTLLEPRLHAIPAVPNANICIISANNASPGFTVPTFPSMKIEKMDEAQGFCPHSNSERYLNETQDGKLFLNANPPSLQRKLLIFDHSGNKTRLFHCPVLPLVQNPFTAATKFTQSCDVNEEGQTTHMDQNYPTNYSLPDEFDENHIVNEEGEMHEDTEEINALLDSDDDYTDDNDDEVTSTDRSPLATKMNNVVQEQVADMKEEVACADSPNKRQKLVSGCKRSSPPASSAGSVRLNETSEYVSDAESFYSCSHMYPAGKTQEVNSLVGDTQSKTDKILESLRVLENIVPGAKGKQPLQVINGTIEYLKSLMSQTGTLGVNHQ